MKAFFLAFAYFLIHPAMTEHVEFALSYSGMVRVTEGNFFFENRLNDYSAQIVLPALLLKAGVPSGLVQGLFSFLCTLLITVSVLRIVNIFCDRPTSRVTVTTTLFVMIFFLARPANITLYPWTPVVTFFEFGNSGMWLAVLIASRLISGERKYIWPLLVSALLWHPVWGALATLCAGVTSSRILHYANNWKTNSALIFIIAVSLSMFGGALVVTKLAKLQPVMLVDSMNSAHNLKISDVRTIGLAVITTALSIFLIISAIPLTKKGNATKIFYAILTATLILQLYIEVSRVNALPIADIVFRSIPNRYLNIIHLFGVLASLRYILNKSIITFTCLISVLLLYLLLTWKSFVLIIVFIAVVRIITKIINAPRYIAAANIFILIAVGFTHLAAEWRTYSYDSLYTNFRNDAILQVLRGAPRDSVVLIGPLVQSHRGLNILTHTGLEYIVPQGGDMMNIYGIDVFCSNGSDKDSFNGFYRNVETCFKDRESIEWKLIAQRIGITHLLVRGDHPITALVPVAKENDLTLYILEKAP